MRGHGVMLIRNSVKDLERAGIVLTGRIERVEGGRPVAVDGTVIDAATVVWCTGSGPDLDWIDIPGVVGDDGLPVQERGLSSGCRGLGFVGMPFQYSLFSPTLMGMDRDAEFVVDRLPARREAQPVASVSGGAAA
jgi:putative flavoprotein involved in K+ transport